MPPYLENDRQLMITADDCGLSEGINHAAYNLHHDGLLTTATLMMNFPATQHAVDMLRDTPTLHGGVHLNLTDGYPLTQSHPDVGLLQADGRFHGRTMLFTRAMFPTTEWLNAVEDEAVAQIRRFVQMTGKHPSHITTHMHFHIIPSLRRLVLRLGKQYRVGWVRAFHTSSTLIPYNFLLQQPAELFHPDNLKITPDYIASVQAWMLQPPSSLAQTLGGINGLIELVVHPDSADDPTYPDEMSHRPAERAKERDYLLALADHLPHNMTIGDPS